jgi:hypothetical protein
VSPISPAVLLFVDRKEAHVEETEQVDEVAKVEEETAHANSR